MEELQKLVTRDYSSNISKAVCNRAISWLHFPGSLDSVQRLTEMDILNFKPGCRCYFMDLGLASYYLERMGAKEAEIAGTLNENFVYINLKKRQDFPEEIAFEMPAFATYKGGRGGFSCPGPGVCCALCLKSRQGKNTGNTARKATLEERKKRIGYFT